MGVPQVKGTSAHVPAEAVAIGQVLAQVEQLRMRGVRLRHCLRPAQQHLAPGTACTARAHCCPMLHVSQASVTEHMAILSKVKLLLTN